MLPAFLIMHAIGCGGSCQGIDAYWFPNAQQCEASKLKYITMRGKTAKVTKTECIAYVPGFWIGELPQ